jgi:hypothetical protein
MYVLGNYITRMLILLSFALHPATMLFFEYYHQRKGKGCFLLPRMNNVVKFTALLEGRFRPRVVRSPWGGQHGGRNKDSELNVGRMC